MTDLETNGYSIQRSIITTHLLSTLIHEAERVTTQARTACIRHLTQKSPTFKDLAHSNTLLKLLPTGMIPVRSILFDKNENNNWSVPWHQDLTISTASKKEVPGYHPWSIKDDIPHVQPPLNLLENMITIRLHLDHTPASNGALRVIPKSHLSGKLPSSKITTLTHQQETICECAAGDALLMKPLILHASKRSTPNKNTPTKRRIIHLEYALKNDLHPSLTWAEI